MEVLETNSANMQELLVDENAEEHSNDVLQLIEKIKLLETEKAKEKEEFGVQRAKLREMYLQKEEEWKRGAAECGKLQEEVQKLNSELNEVKSKLLVATFEMESEQEIERKCKEEIKTLQHIVHETVEESSSCRSKYEHEIRQLQQIIDRLQSEIQELKSQHHQPPQEKGERDSPILVPSIMLTATKTFARKVASQLGGDSSSSSQDNLEENMRKVNKYAQEDAEVLRSVVIPLEEEIEVLKQKLREADEQLLKYQDSCVAHNTKSRNQFSCENLQNLQENDQCSQISQSPSAIEKSSSVASVCSATDAQTVSKSVTDRYFTSLDENLQSPSETSEKGNDVGTPSGLGRAGSNNSISKSHHTSMKCDMCSNYEAQLVSSQHKTKELEKLVANQEKVIQRCHEDLLKEAEFRKKMEEKWNEKKEEHKTKVEELKVKIESAETAMNELQQSYNKTMSEVLHQLEILSKNREGVQAELNRLQNDNDKLIGKHTAHSQQLQNEMINWPDNVEALHELLLKLHEELIAAKVAKETAEEQVETTGCEIRLLREHMEADLHTNKSLTMELKELRKQLAENQHECRRYKALVKKGEADYEAVKSELTETKNSLSKIQEEKKQADGIVAKLRSKIQILQSDLSSAETVQQDFVRLSQSLQVQLEKIRDSDSQVRWQHEDDVEECSGCKSNFSITRKKKQHCSHCGRIFCTVCLNFNVISGPNSRSFKVCAVCHTLLNKDTAPYFSTEAPHNPD